MQSAIENGRLVRERKAIGLKTPLASVTLVDADESAREDFKEVATYIKEELNCLELITEASEDAFLDYKCEPDNKLIGGALKKAYDKKLKTAISKLSSAQLREYLLAGSLMLGDVKIESGWLRVEKVFNAKYLADPDYAGASDMTSSVLLRTALDENLKLMGQSSEMTNRI
jgi:isoleucyl-tRNA synthetase